MYCVASIRARTSRRSAYRWSHTLGDTSAGRTEVRCRHICRHQKLRRRLHPLCPQAVYKVREWPPPSRRCEAEPLRQPLRAAPDASKDPAVRKTGRMKAQLRGRGHPRCPLYPVHLKRPAPVRRTRTLLRDDQGCDPPTAPYISALDWAMCSPGQPRFAARRRAEPFSATPKTSQGRPATTESPCSCCSSLPAALKGISRGGFNRWPSP